MTTVPTAPAPKPSSVRLPDESDDVPESVTVEVDPAL